MRVEEKIKAIKLRKEGKTYSEILAEIPIAKSTLSDWLKSVQLAVPQKQRITRKRLAAAQRGATARRNARLNEVDEYVEKGREYTGSISARELWLIGVALYWAEGSKQRISGPSTGVMFGNSDAKMIKVFLIWLRLARIPPASIYFELYIHETRKADTVAFKEWWAKQIGVSVSLIDKVYFKKGNIKTNRTNIKDLYHGLIRIRVKSSTTLNRKINGWIEGVVSSLGSGVTGNTPAFGAGDSRIVP